MINGRALADVRNTAQERMESLIGRAYRCENGDEYALLLSLARDLVRDVTNEVAGLHDAAERAASQRSQQEKLQNRKRRLGF